MTRWLRSLLVVSLLPWVALVAAPQSAVATPIAHPSLLLSAGDIPALRTKITSGVPAQAWKQLKAKADSYVTPGPNFIFTQQQIFYPDATHAPGWRIYDGATAQNQVGSYLADLSMAYTLSADTRYSDMAKQLMLVEANSDFPAWLASDGVANELGMGDLSKGMALAWDLTYDQWTSAEKTTYLTAVNRDQNNLFRCLKPSWAPIGQAGNNWYGVCGGGTGLLLLAIQGEPALTVDTATLLTNARGRVLPYLQSIYGQYGDGQEGFNYASYGLHNGLPFAFAWKRLQGEDLLALAPGVSNVPRWLALEQIPGKGGRWIDRNDSIETLSNWQEVLPMFYAVRPDGLTAWDWDHTYGPHGDDIFGANAEPAYVAPPVVGDWLCTNPTSDPTRLFACWNSREAFTILYFDSSIAPVDPSSFGAPVQYYPEHGLVDFRSGWSGGQNEIAGTFEARHDGTPGIHTQDDMGEFTLLGYGGQWAVDSGYAGGQNNAGGSGHSLVEINCATNNRNGSFDHLDPITSFAQGPGQMFVQADLRYSYNGTLANVPWANRSVFFSALPGEPAMMVVLDSMNYNNSSVQYCWNMHTDAANSVALLGHNFALIAPSGAALQASTIANGTKDNLTMSPYAAGGAPAVHNVIQDAFTGTTFEHLTAMQVQQQFALNSMTTTAYGVTGGNAADVIWPGGYAQVIATNHGAATASPGGVTMTGVFGKYVSGRGESVLVNGSSLVASGVTYVSVTGGSATVVVGGDQVVVTGPTGLTCSVYAPQTINSVTVNGTATTPSRSGNTLTFAC